MPALLLVAVVLGLNNLAATAGIGAGGVRGGTRVRVAVVFGAFEAGMPLLGLVLGHALATGLGQAACWLGAAALVAVGGAGLVRVVRERRRPVPRAVGAPGLVRDPGPGGPAKGRDWRTGRVVVSGLALSADNLAVGFALGTYHASLSVAVAVIGTVSVAMSLVGLELGARIAVAVGDRSEVLACAVLIAVGAALAAGVL